MKCPLCKKVVLVNEELLENLRAKVCSRCGGRWVQSFQYWKWLERHGDILPEKPAGEGAELAVEDSAAGKLCPECGHFLMRRKVGHGVDFHLDRCNNCGGIWFDKNEWEVLVSRGLHDEVHYVFSAAWQRRIREDETAENFEKRIESTMGTSDYAKLTEITAWINSHPERNTIINYITQPRR